MHLVRRMIELIAAGLLLADGSGRAFAESAPAEIFVPWLAAISDLSARVLQGVGWLEILFGMSLLLPTLSDVLAASGTDIHHDPPTPAGGRAHR